MKAGTYLASLPPAEAAYEIRVRAYEAQGITRSDAQGIVDAEDMNNQTGKNEMNTLTYRAIIIDPIAKTVVLGTVPRDFEAMKRDVLKCDTAQRKDLGEGADVWFDEDGLSKDWDSQGFTRFASCLTLCGVLVIVGSDPSNEDTGMCDLPEGVTLEEVTGMVDFPPPKAVKLPGMTMTTMDDKGKAVTTSIGPKVLTYANH